MKKTLSIAGFVLFLLISISAICALLTMADTIANILGVVTFFIFIYITCEFGVKLYNYIRK